MTNKAAVLGLVLAVVLILDPNSYSNDPHNAVRYRWAEALGVSKGDEPAALFIPQSKPDTFEALPKGDATDGRQLGVITQDFRKPVRRNAA
ncbi:hypothetical protein ATY76_19880 [Rhizobium sp. R339]|nr:hypothetical protein ATY76_19880 [Rhizobium sp. R339]